MIRVIELFSGISAVRKALINCNYDFEIVDSIEIDKYAIKSYNALYNTNEIPKDITNYYPNKKEIGDIDLIWNSSPCTDISLVGKQAGAEQGSGTRSSLIYETFRIIEEIKPKYVIWENVRNLSRGKHKRILDDYIGKLDTLGYRSYYQVLNASDYGIPQSRERIFVVSIRKDLQKGFVFPNKQKLSKTVHDYLESNVDDKYYLSNKMIDYIRAVGTENFHNKDSRINLKIARPLTTIPNKRAGTTNYICSSLPFEYDLQQLGESYPRIRRMTPRESWLLMGFSNDDFDKVKDTNSDTQLYKQAGNSVVVNVIMAILKNLL